MSRPGSTSRARKAIASVVLLVGVLGLAPDLWVWWKGSQDIVLATELSEPRIILVPGASVFRSGRPSPVLRQRVESALELARTWPKARLVLSGSAIPGGYDEPWAMQNFLREHGVDSSRLALDREGRNTRASVDNLGDPGAGLVVVSQRWHLPRALWLARQKGWSAQGLVAGAGSNGAWENVLREHLVRIQNFWGHFLT